MAAIEVMPDDTKLTNELARLKQKAAKKRKEEKAVYAKMFQVQDQKATPGASAEGSAALV